MERLTSVNLAPGTHGGLLANLAAALARPIGPDLALVGPWTSQQFIDTLRKGIDPGGHQLRDDVMPWRTIGKMDDEELRAIYNYLHGAGVFQR